MAQQTINLGAAPDDGTGDTLRVGGDKINDNFDELYDETLKFKGSTDCSTNPNYPAALKGDLYRVSVAGKIGGASGVDIEVGDSYFAIADNAGGDQATVGTSWTVLQGNITSYLPLSGGTLTGDLIVPDEAYDATNWDGSLEVPTKNAVRDKIEAIAGGTGIDVQDEGVAEATGATTLNFVGAGVTAADMGGGVVDVTIAGGGSGIDVEDEGVSEATGATILNFTGSGVTATDVGGGQVDIAITSGGTASGTSFPGTPSTDDLFYRTDRRIEYFYDGTQWLSTQLISIQLGVQADTGATGTGGIGRAAIPYFGVYSLWLDSMDVSALMTQATNWDVNFNYSNSANVATLIATKSLNGNGANTWVASRVSIAALLSANARSLYLTLTENAGTASCFAHITVWARLVG